MFKKKIRFSMLGRPMIDMKIPQSAIFTFFFPRSIPRDFKTENLNYFLTIKVILDCVMSLNRARQNLKKLLKPLFQRGEPLGVTPFLIYVKFREFFNGFYFYLRYSIYCEYLTLRGPIRGTCDLQINNLLIFNNFNPLRVFS